MGMRRRDYGIRGDASSEGVTRVLHAKDEADESGAGDSGR
jgi:hypothetical protein